uniref:Uncharacterized protein n=1 Tax=Mantoniella antarctica TaxID=81844 RepID=A0A7S0X2B6_9CHLO|mmetsp:Transcript_12253/g.29684  ORF Transcript_12253/g.29684 Transcript_12253/m.29684 type:complete len:214 (+) Transcript_12253:158-799(+)
MASHVAVFRGAPATASLRQGPGPRPSRRPSPSPPLLPLRGRRRPSTWVRGAGGERGGGTFDNGRMHVPADAFGGMSPEYKAAGALKNLFTMVAIRVVMAQEQEEQGGYANGGGDAMTDTHRTLRDYLVEHPLRDGNAWLEQLMRHEDGNMRRTALRLLEVRKAYASGQFDFADMHQLAVKELTRDNDKLMADYVADSMSLSVGEGMGMDGLQQ